MIINLCTNFYTDQLTTSCTHMVTPTEISPPTRALISSLMKGAIYALADASELSNIQNESGKSILFSHIILFRQGKIHNFIVVFY